MAELASDTFDRADNADLGSLWDVMTGRVALAIVSNAVRASAGSSDAGESYNGVTWPDDQWSEVTLQALAAGSLFGPMVRASAGANTAYSVEVDVNGATLYKTLAGTWSVIGSYVGSFSITDTLMLEAQGTTITLKQNGVTRISVSDSDIASGRAGIHGFVASVSAAEVASWRGGDFSSPTERHHTRRTRQVGAAH